MNAFTFIGMTEKELKDYEEICELMDKQSNLKVHYYRKGMMQSELTEDDLEFDRLQKRIDELKL